MWCFDPAKNELSSKGAYSIERVVLFVSGLRDFKEEERM